MLKNCNKKVLALGTAGAMALLLVVLLAVFSGKPAENINPSDSTNRTQVTDNATDPVPVPPNTIPKEDDTQNGEQGEGPEQNQTTEDPAISENPGGENGETTPSGKTTTPPEGQGTTNQLKIGQVKKLNGTVSGTEITLTWDKVANATGYEVQVKINEASYVSVGQAITNSITLNGFEPGSEVWIKVRAYNTTMSATT